MRTSKSTTIVSIILLLILTITTTLTVISCQSQTYNSETSTSNQSDCRTIEHEVGETQVCGQPQRIVVLGPYFLEPLIALGMQPSGFGDHVAFHQGDYDNPSRQILYLGSRITQPIANVGLAYEPSIEAIVKVQPDLIIGNQGLANQYQTLSQIAPTILLNWLDGKTNLKVIAQAVDRTPQAEQLLTQTESRIASARKTFAPLIASNPKMLLLYSGQLKQITLSGSDQLCHSLPQKLGFQLVSPPGLDRSEPNSIVPISIETLPQLNEADLVILLGHNFEELEELDNFKENQLSNLKQAWRQNEIAQSLDASKAGRVYFIPSYLCLGLPGTIGTKLYLEELEKQLLSQQN